MSKYTRLAATAFLSLILVGGLAAAAHAVTPSAAQTQLDSARDRLALVRQHVEEAKQREAGLRGQVAAFDQRLDAITGQLSAIEAEIARVDAKARKTEAELARLRARLEVKTAELREAQAELETQEAAFERRVVATYKQGEVDYLDVLLGSRDYDDFVTRLDLVRELVGSDNQFVGQLDAARARVAAQKAALVADREAATKARAALARQGQRLEALRADAAAKEQSLLAARQAKAGLLQKAATTRAAWEAQEDQLLAESNQLAAIIAGRSGGAVHSTGQLIWPVNGVVTSGFGWRMHPIFHVMKFHTGIDIAAAYGTPIKAADGGSVIYAGGMTGYGNVTIINHGRGLSTLYAHQSRLAVGSGTVTRGQVIGYVGSTGFSTGPHLHFEVRVNGNPVNPLGYLH